MEEGKSYYREKLPELIKKLKSSAEKILPIIDDAIDTSISDDKIHHVLKAKRQAAEDVVWIYKRIDELETELNTPPTDSTTGEDNTQKEEIDSSLSSSAHPSKKYARRQQ